jgi:CDP-diacylglycerol--serine O-phosphatidyltransferase
MKERFRTMIENKKWIKGIPNSLTLCNSLCGFASILITIQAYKYVNDPGAVAKVFAWSAAMILFAMVFDAFDGYAARILNAASMHGIQMDSLADMVTFGVAPATLVAVMAHHMRHIDTVKGFIPVCILAAVYLGSAALRLATYNVHAIQDKKSSGDKFSGLPSPGAAAAICSLVIFVAYRDGKVNRLLLYLPWYTAILGLLMVSKVPYVHFAKWLISTKRNKKRLLFLIVILLLWIITGFAFSNPIIVPLVLINGYVIWGPLTCLAVKIGFISPRPELVPDIAEHKDS